MRNALILAGGPGSRLWPLSRSGKPKQIIELFAGKPMLQVTIERLKQYCPDINIYIAIGTQEEERVKEAIKVWPDVKVIVEPYIKNTGPGIALAVATLHSFDPGGELIVFPSDHYVEEPKKLFDSVEFGETLLDKDGRLILYGATPTYPATKYGYIKVGAPIELTQNARAFTVDTFIEKPDEERATELISDGKCLWNMGIFMGKLSTFRQLFREHAPALWHHIQTIENAIGTDNERSVTQKEYYEIESISIDYAIIEKCRNLVVVPVGSNWSDLGDWSAIYNVLPKTPEGNALVGNVHTIDTIDSYLYTADKPIIAVGVSDMIVVNTADVILVVPLGKAQSVTKVRKYLESKGLHGLL